LLKNDGGGVAVGCENPPEKKGREKSDALQEPAAIAFEMQFHMSHLAKGRSF